MQNLPHSGFLRDNNFFITYHKVDNKWFGSTLNQGYLYLTHMVEWMGKQGNHKRMHYRSWDRTPQQVYDEGATIIVRHPRNKLWSGLSQDLFTPRQSHNEKLHDFVRKKPNSMFHLHDEYYDDDLYNLGITKDKISHLFFDKHYDQILIEMVGLFNHNFSRIWNLSHHSSLFYYAFDEYRQYEPIRNIPFNWMPIEELDFTESLKHVHRPKPGRNNYEFFRHSLASYRPVFEDVMEHPFLYPRVRDRINKVLDKEIWYYEKLKRVIPRFNKTKI